MEVEVIVRVGARVIKPNEKGEMEFESAVGAEKIKVQAELVKNIARESQSFEELDGRFKDTGVAIGYENSKTTLIETTNGAHIFIKGEPGRKISVKDITSEIKEELLSITDQDPINAARKIFEAHGWSKNQIEEVITSDRDGVSVEREAQDVDSKDITDGSEIGAARLARDSQENTWNGIYGKEDSERILSSQLSDEERRLIEEKMLKESREKRAGMSIEDKTL